MSISTHSRSTAALSFESLNWVAADALARDQTQSHRLHEPEHRTNSADPMTGEDIENVTTHPSLVDGDLTLYFETKATRKAYLDTPVDHPNPHLPYPASDTDDRGG
ncbi:MAG: hypothetical protein OQL08_06225 [Gammaproteobacteria bacterium]|nr:hypothetical protein [Gammaproteobacteria bacterium]